MKQFLKAAVTWLLLGAPTVLLPGCEDCEGGDKKKNAPATNAKATAYGPETSAIPPDLSRGWCSGHGVPESVCTGCNDSLAERFKAAGDWCEEHGLPESQCTRCHPEVKARWEKLKSAGDQAPGAAPQEDSRHGSTLRVPPEAKTQNTNGELCDAHGIARDVCVRCNPALASSFKEEGDWCGTHDVPESQCTICNQALRDQITSRSNRKAAALPRSQRPPSPVCTKDKTKVRLASAALAERAGLSYEAVARRPLTISLTCNAEVAYDGNRFVELSSRVPGAVGEVHADLGAKVRRGDVLAVIDSPELATAKAELLRATASVDLYAKTLTRHASLESIGVTAKRTLEEADNRLAEAKIEEARAMQGLRALGVSDEEVRSIRQNGETSALLRLTTPFDGEIVERNAVIGENVGALRMLFAVADTARMWAILDLTDPRVQLRAAMPVVLQIEGFDAESFAGRITWVSTQLDPKTRTLKARAEFDNADGLLKANMFGRATVQLRENEDTLVVPKQAVQWDGCCNIVFVKEDETTFQPRKVLLGLVKDDFFEVRDGLREGELVVVDGSFLLKTEILRGEIGAGCCPNDIKKKNQ